VCAIGLIFHPCRIFAGKSGAYLSAALFGLHSNGRFLVLPESIRLGRKWMAVVNTLSYYDTATITAWAGEVNCIFNFLHNLQMGQKKLECYIKLGWQGLPEKNTQAYWAILFATKKWSVVNRMPEAVFKTFHLLCNLPRSKISYCVTFHWAEKAWRENAQAYGPHS
jgi:hypothetical protein